MNRGFAGLHPITQLCYYCGVTALCMTVRLPLLLALLTVVLILCNLRQDRGRRMRKNLALYLVSGLALLVLTPLTSHRGATILCYFLNNPITLESILYGAVSGLSVAALLLACTSFQLAVDADGVLYLLCRALPNTTMVILTALRFVPLFQRRLREIREVQGTRPGKEAHGVRGGMRVCGILLSGALCDAVATAQSMRTRGYGLSRRRSFYFPYKMDKRNIILLSVMFLLLLCIILLTGMGALDAQLFPKLALPAFTPLRACAAGCALMFAAIPIWLGGARYGAAHA